MQCMPKWKLSAAYYVYQCCLSFVHVAFYEKLEVESDGTKPNHLVVAITSDKGLCGGVHSAICKAIKADVAEKSAESNIKVVAVGDKARGILARYADNIVYIS